MVGDEAYTIPAAKHRRPLLQGDLSNLCGLYSIVNALGLAFHPVRPFTSHDLKASFLTGIQHLNSTKQLPQVFACGMEPAVWLELLRTLVGHARVRHGYRLRCDRILRGIPRRDRDEAFNAIFWHLKRDHPVLMTMWDAYDHTTVLCGYTGSRLTLYDSYGFKWVKRSSCSFTHDGTRNRHRITRRSVIALVPERP